MDGAPLPEAAPPALYGASGQVAIRDTDGSVSLVRPEDLSRAQDEGARPATQAEFYGAKHGVAGEIVSAADGAARGLSFGLSDPAQIALSRAIGGDAAAASVRRQSNLLRESSPNAALGGEIVGSLASMAMLPGGAAAGAVRGESMLARGAYRALSAAPRAFVEGAAIGVGQQASEDALGNHDATAEKYLAAGLHGGALAAILGGVAHAGIGAIADRAGGRFYGSATREGESLLTREAESGGRAGPYRASGSAAREAEGVAPRGNMLSDMAEEQAFKATGAKIRDIQKLGTTAEAQGERAKRIGRTLLDEGIVDATATQEAIAERLTAKTRAVGEELSAMRAKLDTAVARPSTAAIVDRVNTEVLAPLERLPGTQTEVGAVRAYLDDFAAKAGETPSFDTLHKFRRALDEKLDPKLWNRIPGSAPPAAQELGRVRGIIEGEFEAAGERAANELGDTFGGKYKLAKQLYGDLRTAEKIVVKEVARGGANRAISLTDTIMAGAGLAAGGPLGLLAAGGNKLVRTFGNQAAASLLDKASRLEGLQRAVAHVEDGVRSGVAGFLKGETQAAGRAASRPVPKVSQQSVAEIREATRDPQALTARIADMLGQQGLRDAAPKTAQAIASTAMRAAVYLRDKAPKEPAPTGVSFVPQRPRAGSVTEQARFASAVEAISDPVRVVDDLRHGRLNRDKVDALKAVYPQLYDLVRREIAAQATTLAPTLSTQQEVQLSVLFGTPVSAMMQPQNVLALQETIANGQAQVDQAQPPSGGGGQSQQVRGLNRRGTLASGFDQQEKS